MRIVFSFLLFLALILPAAAAIVAPALPANAKKLAHNEIVARYDGTTVKWKEYNQGGYGVVTYDLKHHKQTGTATFNGKTTSFTGPIRVRRDQICFALANGQETCRDVYINGKTTYEVDRNGKVVGTTVPR